MKYIKEYAFWNKDSDIAEKILKNLDELSNSDIKKVEDRIKNKYVFDIKGFKISADYDAFLEKDDNDLAINPLGHYTIKVDDVKIDISWNQGRKIYNKAKRMFDSVEKEEEEHIKKDARISL